MSSIRSRRRLFYGIEELDFGTHQVGDLLTMDWWTDSNPGEKDVCRQPVPVWSHKQADSGVLPHGKLSDMAFFRRRL